MISDNTGAAWFHSGFLCKNLMLSGYPSIESIKLLSKLYSLRLASNFRFSSFRSFRNTSKAAWVSKINSLVFSCCSCNCCKLTRCSASSPSFSTDSCCNCWSWFSRCVFSSLNCWKARCKFWMEVSATATFFSASNCFNCNCWYCPRMASNPLRFSSKTLRFSSMPDCPCSTNCCMSANFTSSSDNCNWVYSMESPMVFNWPFAFSKKSCKPVSFSRR